MERDEINYNGGALPKTIRVFTQNSERPLVSTDNEFNGANRHINEPSPESFQELSTKDSETNAVNIEISSQNDEECDNVLSTDTLAELQSVVHLYQDYFQKKHGVMTTPYSGTNLFELKEFKKKITSVVENKFDSLCMDKKLLKEKTRSLAAFVITERKANQTTFKVASMATGGRRLEDENVKENGRTVNDCHAIVLARRGLLVYLYNKAMIPTRLMNLVKEEKIFLHKEGKLILKDRFKIHLYSRSIPCGCARCEEPDGSNKPCDYSLSIKSPNSLGTLKMDKSIDSRSRMSCSDKILKWNVLGLQGAILSRYMKPVYIESIYIKSHVSHQHIKFALSERYLEKFVKDMPADFERRVPKIYTDHVAPKVEKENQYASVWDHYSKRLDVLDLKTGGLVPDEVKLDPRVCKMDLFGRFEIFHKHYYPDSDMPCYKAAKEHTKHSYQFAKKTFMKTLEVCGYGSWVRNDKKDEFNFQDPRCEEH